jgi:hypothetical protein
VVDPLIAQPTELQPMVGDSAFQTLSRVKNFRSIAPLSFGQEGMKQIKNLILTTSYASLGGSQAWVHHRSDPFCVLEIRILIDLFG